MFAFRGDSPGARFNRLLGRAAFLAIAPPLLAGGFFKVSDAPHYIALAQGRPAMLPFASRQLAPLVVRGLSRAMHLSLEHAFLFQGLLALAVFLAATVHLLRHARMPLWLCTAVLLQGFWCEQFARLVLPDLLFAALLALLLTALAKGRLMMAALLLFPLELTRESTPLVLLCLFAALWPRLRAWFIATALAATAAGALVTYHLTRNALPNREGLPAGLYLLGKVPWNVTRNLLGLRLWTNVAENCPAGPVWQMPVHLGSRITAAGVCTAEWHHPAATAVAWLASFGLLPMLWVYIRRSLPQANSPLLRFCVLYGAISFLSAPLLGESILRLAWYSWPLWLVAVPMLLARSGGGFRMQGARTGFLGLHLLVSWCPYLLPDLASLAVTGVAGTVAWFLLRHRWASDRVTERGVAPFPDARI